MSRSDQKLQTHQRILEAAGKGFRKGGFGGVGVDALAKEAGVTSGAFYVHFGSKSQAFSESVVHGMEVLKHGIRQFQNEHDNLCWNRFVGLQDVPQVLTASIDDAKRAQALEELYLR